MTCPAAGSLSLSYACYFAAALFGAYEGWTAHSGNIEVPDWGYAFLGVGIVFGPVIGCGLMALVSTAAEAATMSARRCSRRIAI
jgi:hypothetical protein